MKSLLNALQEGRLIELPEADKETSLKYLAHLIEAVPDLGGNPELAEAILAREKVQNTAIGLGVACPHARVPGTGELLCAVGWTPIGVAYGAPDGRPVHLLVMYYIPEAQKNVYLKEVSALSFAIQKSGGIGALAEAKDLTAVREKLLDWVSAAIDASLPETKARMIRLDAKQAQIQASASPTPELSAVLPVLVLTQLTAKPMVLCQDGNLAADLEGREELPDLVSKRGQFELAGFRFIFRNAAAYSQGRMLYDYLAVK